jgi:hypothetical protein
MEKKSAPKLFDAYLCFWCRGWHIGGKFSLKGLIQRRFREVSRLLRFK